MDKKVKYWIDIAKYDLETAEAMLNAKRYLYVGFMCHQVIEKSVKAYYQKKVIETPPYIHDLNKLAIKSNLISKMTEEQINFIFLLNPFNIESRYPSYKDRIAKTLTSDFCNNILEKTKEMQRWIEKQL